MSAHVRAVCEDPDCGGSCVACTLLCCSVCGGAEASLTTDCPGVPVVDYRVVERVTLDEEDYTDALGWHLTAAPRRAAVPRFEDQRQVPA